MSSKEILNPSHKRTNLDPGISDDNLSRWGHRYGRDVLELALPGSPGPDIPEKFSGWIENQNRSDAVVGDENVAVVVQRDVDRLLEVVVADGGDCVPVQADLGHSLRAPVDHNLERLEQ